MDISVLEEIGLTNGEIKTYLAVLELGSTTSGPAIKKSNLQSSVFYNSLNSLIEKGLITYIKKGKIRYYQSIDPYSLVDFLEDKKTRLKEIIPQLLAKQKSAENKETAEIFEGKNGIRTAYYSMLSDVEKGETYQAFAMAEQFQNKEIVDFFVKFDKKRNEENKVVNLLANLKDKNFFKENYKQVKNLNLRFTNINIPLGINITKNSLMFTIWGEEPVCYRILSKELSKRFSLFFEDIWKTAKK